MVALFCGAYDFGGVMRLENETGPSGANASTVLAECQSELDGIRVQIAELKRIGSAKGMPELLSAASGLSMRIARVKLQNFSVDA